MPLCSSQTTGLSGGKCNAMGLPFQPKSHAANECAYSWQKKANAWAAHICDTASSRKADQLHCDLEFLFIGLRVLDERSSRESPSLIGIPSRGTRMLRSTAGASLLEESSLPL